MVDQTALVDTAFESGAAAARSRRDVIDASGPDAAEYLHGQLSQDVHGLAVGSSAMTLLLQPQGKIEAWMRLSHLADDHFWLDVDAGHGAQALERLQRFKLRTACELSMSTHEVVSVRGPAAADGPAPLGIRPPEGTVVLDALWPGTAGFDVFAAPGDWLGERVPEVPTEALDALRIRLGIPAMGAELDSSTIPAAAGIVERSVDFSKGCYVGQELVARIDSRGSNTPTKLRGVRFSGPADVAPGTIVVRDDQEIGTLTSITSSAAGAAPAVGLAYLKRAVDVPARAVVADRSGELIPVEVIELPVD